MRVYYRPIARDDVIRQFRHYLVTMAVPDVATRFRTALKDTVESLRQHPLIGPRYPLQNPHLQNLRSWPVTGFEALKIYYLVQSDGLHVIRMLHQKRDVRRLLENEQTPA